MSSAVHPDLKFVETPDLTNFEQPNEDYFIKYQVIINKKECIIFKNNKGTTTNGKTQLPAGYLKVFNKAINEYEKSNVSLAPNNGIMYLNPKKAQTNFIQINAYCSHCKNIKKGYGKYKISIKENPTNDSYGLDFVTVNVERQVHFLLLLLFIIIFFHKLNFYINLIVI